MNLSFDQQYEYIALKPVDTVRSELESIVRSPWYDISINLAGEVSEDNTFKLYPKLSMGLKAFGKMQEFAVINGRLEPHNEQTNLQITIGPPGRVLLAFYAVFLIFLFKLIGLFLGHNIQDLILVSCIFLMVIIIGSFIYFSVGRLKNRFEKTMLLHPEE